jgi:patatin-like phospholipase/acyl hydrolase
LAILQNVVREVGHGIPVQELFDLVIGTSAGGLIALGLFKQNWTLEDALVHFKDLSKEAFEPRRLLRVPVFKNTAQIFCSYRYDSEGIRSALKTAFGSSPLFGHDKDAIGDVTKVGVVAAVQSKNRPVLFANYTRNAFSGTFISWS